MLSPAHEMNLADRHYVTLILRLTLDRSGRLIHGELVDTAGTQPEWFLGVVGLNQAVATWLKEQEQSEENLGPC